LFGGGSLVIVALATLLIPNEDPGNNLPDGKAGAIISSEDPAPEDPVEVAYPREEDGAVPASIEKKVKEPQLKTLDSFLSDYWGGQWPEIRYTLRIKGIDLTREIDFSEMPTWEEALPKLKKIAPESIQSSQTPANYNRMMFKVSKFDQYYRGYIPGAVDRGFSDEAIKAVRQSIEPSLQDLYTSCLEYNLELGKVVRNKLNTGDFEKFPIVSFPLGPQSDKTRLSMRTFSYKGWIIKIDIFEGDHPGIDAILSVISEKKDELDRAIKAQLGG